MAKLCDNCAHHSDGVKAAICDSCKITYCNGIVATDPTHWEPKTNADRIRAMSDEELAKFLDNVAIRCPRPSITEDCSMPQGCEKCVMVWLQQPCEGD